LRVLQLGTVAAWPWWVLFGVRGLKDSGTVAAVLSMIQAVNGCGGAVVDSVGRPAGNGCGVAVVGSPGVHGRGFIIKDSGTVAAVLSMIQAVDRCGFSSWERWRRGRGRFA